MLFHTPQEDGYDFKCATLQWMNCMGSYRPCNSSSRGEETHSVLAALVPEKSIKRKQMIMVLTVQQFLVQLNKH